MRNDIDYAELVKEAQLGDKDSLERLTELARERLRVDVYRLTLQQNITDDIVQESLLEMFKILSDLKEAHRFWPWLYKIALNKMRLHHRTERRRKDVTTSAGQEGQAQGDSREVMVGAIGAELKQIVLTAMQRLKPRHRAVLMMRCYREMEYDQIAETMECSEFAAKMLFFRAKKSLRRELGRYGFGKGLMITALVLFGKMTAPSEAAGVSVTAATMKVGIAAGIVGMAMSKTAVVTLATAGVVAAGAMVATTGGDKTPAPGSGETVIRQQIGMQKLSEKHADEECWYYYPEKSGDSVMMRLVEWDSKQESSHCRWLQNKSANYYFDKDSDTIYIRNYRMWDGDLAVRRLPTDPPELSGFISRVEGRTSPSQYVRRKAGGLLVIASHSEKGDSSQITQHYNIPEEQYFLYGWSAEAKLADTRDTMHKRGWTYFRISGQIDGKQVRGTGRLPFVYETSKMRYPWLKMQVGEQLRIVDNGRDAYIHYQDGTVLGRYEGGSFFLGLSRPWMGLHTVDTVRRDAAKDKVWFESKLLPGTSKGQVVLSSDENKLIYTIDMEMDVVEKITFTSGQRQGVVEFTYLQEIGQVSREFATPRQRSYAGRQRDRLGILWLVHLFEAKP